MDEEIERLRQENADLRAITDGWRDDGRRIDALAAENKRLRAALGEISNDPNHAVTIALAALGPVIA